ncbi:MAG: putative porin [Saprospiraceae bacterium]|nr:putative porin [Saprospiraceae bacterium]
MDIGIHPMIKCVIASWLIITHFSLLAQRPGQQNSNFGNNTTYNNPFARDSSSQAEDYTEERDTFGIFYFSVNTPNQLVPLSDTALSNFHIVDPLRLPAVDAVGTGNFGAANRSIWYETPFRKGFDMGFHQFDAYYILPEQMKYNVLKTPFTNIFYSQGATQSDGYFKAHFARNFAKGIRFTLDHKSIKQLGSTRQYPNQQVENNALGTGIWWDAPSGRYDGFLTYTSNNTREQENGGLTAFPNNSNDGAPGGNRAQTAIALLNDSTMTRHAHQTLSYTQYLKLLGRDSTNNNLRDFTIFHKIQYQNSTFKHYDQQRGDTALVSFYGDLYTDERGLRYFTRVQSATNEFSLSTYRKSEQVTDSNQESDRVEIGFTHAIYLLDQEAKDTIINNLLLIGKVNFRIKDKFDLKTYAHLSLLDNAGDFRVRGDIFFDIGKIGQLSATFINQAYSPTLTQHEFYISKRNVWNNQFKKTIETSLTGAYELPSLQLSLRGGYHLINNFIYFEANGLPKQIEAPINIVQLLAQHRLRIWKIYFENTLALQATTQSVIRTPNWFSKHTLYVEASLFKKALDFQLGTTLKMNETYLGYYYQPITGQFQLENDNSLLLYPLWDAYFTLKIKTVRFFLRAENLTYLLNNDTYYSQIATYPQPLFHLRFGLDWRFFN